MHSTPTDVSRPTIYLDFDRTLCNTDQLYHLLGFRAGVTLSSEERVSLVELARKRSKDIDWPSLVYGDTFPTLRALHEHFRIVIVSFATIEDFQRMKIDASGVGSIVDAIFVVDGDKSKAILRDQEGRNVQSGGYFLDDRLEHVHDVRTVLPGITSVAMCRPDALGSLETRIGAIAEGIPVVQNLDEFSEHVFAGDRLW